MYRILLVDDEKMELEALKNYIDWKTLGIDHVDTAKNGKAAYELVLDRQPDIVITDIQMPVMNGVNLAKKIYEWNRDIKIIFLTGYDDFAYIKEAFQVNAVNYILKPFSEESIAEVIHRAIKQIEKENLFQNSVDVMEKLLLQRLCTEEQIPEDRLLQELKQVSGEKNDGRFGMVQFFQVFQKNLDRSMEKKLAEIETVWLDGSTLTFLIWGYVDFHDAAFRIQKILKELTGKSYGGKRSLKPIQESFREPEGTGRKEYFRELESFKNQLEGLIRAGQDAEIGKLLAQAFTFFSEEKIEKEEVLQFLYRVSLKLERKIMPENREGKEKQRENQYENLRKCCCIEEARDYVDGILKTIEEKRNQQLGDCKSAYVVRKVQEYVRSHYS